MMVGCSPEQSQSTDGEARLSLTETLSGSDTVGYARALEPRPFEFPADHGPHEDFRTEWWYVTGNLGASEGREFGFQFTIFRSALAPADSSRASRWATNQAYMAHFTLTDVQGEEFWAFERFARGAVGLAGARTDPLEIWLDNWSISESPGSAGSRGGASSVFPLRLRAEQDGLGLDLSLSAGKPVVLQGDEGLSQKGPEPGNASYYYSFTRLPAEGQVVVRGDTLSVSGLAWFDREWSTSALSEGQVGWDWFSLQLDGGWEVMMYQLRLENGTADPLSDGVLVAPDGARIELEWGSDLSLDATGSWTSELDGAEYPSGWRLQIPERGWDLVIEPILLDQELDLSFRYWEGAVSVTGVGPNGEPTAGKGYVELTGYAGQAPGR